ncbi:MAG: hypothetical protein AB7W16_27665 [Candidatus Obscuribacterales bacterium]
MPADCAYCGQAVDGDGFICSHCAGSPQAPLEYTFEAMKHATDSAAPTPHAPHFTHVRPESPAELIEDSKPEMIQVKAERPDRFSSTEIKKTAKPKEGKKKEEGKKKKERKAPAVDWKKQKVHRDFIWRAEMVFKLIKTVFLVTLGLSSCGMFQSGHPFLGVFFFIVACTIWMLLSVFFKVFTVLSSTPWNRFATYIYNHRPPQECLVKVIYIREPYTVGELITMNPSGKDTKRSRFKVVNSVAVPAILVKSIESNRLPNDLIRGSLRRGSTEGLDAAVITIGDCRFWCTPDRG